jgi:hypothetical protein
MGERRLGIDNEALLSDCGELMQKKAAVGETGLGAEEGKSPGCVELDQPGEIQAAEKHTQHPHRRKAGRDNIQRGPTSEMPPPRTIMWTWGWCVIADPHVWSTTVMQGDVRKLGGKRDGDVTHQGVRVTERAGTSIAATG